MTQARINGVTTLEIPSKYISWVANSNWKIQETNFFSKFQFTRLPKEEAKCSEGNVALTRSKGSSYKINSSISSNLHYELFLLGDEDFGWEGDKDRRNIPWVSWKTLCLSKGKGRLGSTRMQLIRLSW